MEAKERGEAQQSKQISTLNLNGSYNHVNENLANISTTDYDNKTDDITNSRAGGEGDIEIEVDMCHLSVTDHSDAVIKIDSCINELGNDSIEIVDIAEPSLTTDDNKVVKNERDGDTESISEKKVNEQIVCTEEWGERSRHITDNKDEINDILDITDHDEKHVKQPKGKNTADKQQIQIIR